MRIAAREFVSVFLVFPNLLGLTGLVPTVLMPLFSDFDWNPIRTGYLCITLLGALFLFSGPARLSHHREPQSSRRFLKFRHMVARLIRSISCGARCRAHKTLGQIISYVSFMDHYDCPGPRALSEAKHLVYFFSSLAFMLI